jgi:acyl carrier protein
MTAEELTEGLRELLRRQKDLRCDVDAVVADSRLDGLGFDSLTILDFIYDVEDRFGVQVQMGDLVGMERVGELVAYLQARLPQ